MNLHHIVRCAITAVHADEQVTVYHAVGQVNVKGRLVPSYLPPVITMAQVQRNAESLAMTDAASRTEESVNIWLYAAKELPTTGIRRTLSRTGDFIRRSDGSWWLVTSVNSDYTEDGWVSVTATRQVKEPEIEVVNG